MVVDECDIIGNGPEIDIPYWTGGGGFAGNGGTGGGSLESDERDCCDIDGRLIVDPDIDRVRSSKESDEPCEDDVIPDMADEFTKEGAVVAVDPLRGFDREKSFGIRTDEEVSLRPATLDPDECVLPWWCSWFWDW